METITLPAFYQAVNRWPESDGELSLAAERVCALMGAHWSSIYQMDVPARLAFRFSVPDVIVNPDAMSDYVRRKCHEAESLSTPFQIRQLQISGEQLPWAGFAGAPYLSLLRLSVDNRPAGPGPRAIGSDRNRVDFGWLMIGTAKALTPREEQILVAAAEHLAMLGAIARLESGIQLRNQFLSIASHELKTPLTSIYGILQLQERMMRMQREEDPNVQRERQESYLKMVIRQVRRLNELIDGLLDVSRIQNGRFMVEPSDTDVAAIVRDTTSTRLVVIAQEAGVSVQLDVPELLRAWVDPVRMEEVVTNLVMNAIRFSPEGGVVWVRLRDDNGLLRLTVRDQGPSVPVEDRERIFQPFERAQRTARFGGLGLGLFISRQIAQLHGGNVGLMESVPGRGNVFEASFPIRANHSLSETA